MTESGFDWQRLTTATPEVHAEPRRSTLPAATARWLAIGALVAAVGLTGIALAVTAPHPELVIDDAQGGTTVAAVDAAAVMVAGPSAAPITVDVDGAVMHPGLVTLPAGSRVGDAVAAAGGFTPAADARAAASLNLAAPLVDGSQVSVPDRGATSATGPATPVANAASGPALGPGPIDLATATVAQLDTLPGIGPVTAQKILAARDEAPFTSVDDLLKRKVVGPSTFEKIKPLVTVNGR
ncbi:MAG TPA: ComEA family DNA-binding protein [Candidatus Limnocylindrales bacterium]|jgi:competence protein ComEA